MQSRRHRRSQSPQTSLRPCFPFLPHLLFLLLLLLAVFSPRRPPPWPPRWPPPLSSSASSPRRPAAPSPSPSAGCATRRTWTVEGPQVETTTEPGERRRRWRRCQRCSAGDGHEGPSHPPPSSPLPSCYWRTSDGRSRWSMPPSHPHHRPRRSPRTAAERAGQQRQRLRTRTRRRRRRREEEGEEWRTAGAWTGCSGVDATGPQCSSALQRPRGRPVRPGPRLTAAAARKTTAAQPSLARPAIPRSGKERRRRRKERMPPQGLRVTGSEGCRGAESTTSRRSGDDCGRGLRLQPRLCWPSRPSASPAARCPPDGRPARHPKEGRTTASALRRRRRRRRRHRHRHRAAAQPAAARHWSGGTPDESSTQHRPHHHTHHQQMDTRAPHITARPLLSSTAARLLQRHGRGRQWQLEQRRTRRKPTRLQWVTRMRWRLWSVAVSRAVNVAIEARRWLAEVLRPLSRRCSESNRGRPYHLYRPHPPHLVC